MDVAWQQHWRTMDREQPWLFLRFFVIVSAAFCLLWQASLYFDALLENRQRRAAMVEATRHARDLLGSQLQVFAVDLKILAQGGALHRLLHGVAGARAEVEAEFFTFMTEKADTAQLRYLDRSGQEIVRVDRSGDAVSIVASDELQNKAARYYFSESVGLPEGRVYVSRIDLNVENGVIEVPWRPSLRLAVALHLDGGESAGIIILNIDVTKFIDDLQRARPLGSAPFELVNAAGYWLGGVPRDRLFGFMFASDDTMAVTAPEAWRKIAAEQIGSVEYAGNVYIFDTLLPSAYLNAERAAAGGTEQDEAGIPIAWKVLGIVPKASLADAWRLDRLPVALAALAIIAAMSLVWSQGAAVRRKTEREKQRTETELVRVERLASLGGLVAGVAHELNTPIGNAVAVASTLRDEIEGLSGDLQAGQISRSRLEGLAQQFREGTGMMMSDLGRAARLIGNFKQIAVDQTSEQRRRFRIGDLISDVTGSLQPQIKGRPVDLQTRVHSRIELDNYAGPLSQVLINLVGNALFHGFPDGCAGQIAIAARDLSPQEIELVVEDNGAGIPAEHRKRIFEPFFTTRLGEGGSGLGLSIVFNIVTNILGGTIKAECPPSGGTRMVLRLPASAPDGAAGHLERIYDV